MLLRREKRVMEKDQTWGGRDSQLPSKECSEKKNKLQKELEINLSRQHNTGGE